MFWIPPPTPGLGVGQLGPGHEVHADVRAAGPAVIVQQEGRGLGVAGVIGSGEVNNIVPESLSGDLQINVCLLQPLDVWPPRL